MIGFAGMTHLGLVSAVAGAEAGFEIVCFDPEPARIAALLRGEYPVAEPRLPELAANNGSRLRFTANVRDLAACDLVYVAPDVPTDDRGNSDLAPVDALLGQVLDAVPAQAVVVVLSQVPPGFTRARLRAGRTLYYQVETLIFGLAIERALRPERYIIGCADPAQALPQAYQSFLDAGRCPVMRMRFESAELAKISINVCLAASLSAANTLAELCEKVGADWLEIMPALRLDRRIGPHAYIAAGLGIGGGNIERDLATVVRIADEQSTDATVVRGFLSNSEYRKGWAARALRDAVDMNGAGLVIGILGLAYKPRTASLKNSPAIELIRQLGNCRVKAFDPQARIAAREFGYVTIVPAAADAVAQADAVAIMTPWPEFRGLRPADIAAGMRGRVVLDPFRVLDADAARAAGLHYRTLGAR